MDEDIVFIRRAQSYLPLAMGNLLALLFVVISLSPPPRHWLIAALIVGIAVLGNVFWLRRQATKRAAPSPFLNLEIFQIACNGIGVIWFGIWAIVAYEPWKLLACGIAAALLVFRLKVRAEKQARSRSNAASAQ